MNHRSITLLMLALCACTAKKSSFDAGPPAPPPVPFSRDAGDEALAECRTAATHARETGKWAAAETQCAAVVTDKPAELAEVIARLRREAGAAKHLSVAQELVVHRSYPQALVELANVPADTRAFAIGGDVFKAANDGVLAQRSLECGTAWMHQDPATVEVCDRYFQARCDTPERPVATPPAKKKLKLEGPLGRDGWRPDDPLLTRFLIARHKSNPRAAPWACATQAIGDPAFETGCASVAVESLRQYCIHGASAAQQLAATEPKLAEQAAEAGRAFQAGKVALDSGQFEKAAEQFRVALDLDAKLMPPGDGKGATSMIRRRIELDFPAHALERGNELASAAKYEPACAAWKLGEGVSKGNPELLKAMGLCTARAHALLAKAKHCEELPAIEKLAVDGDGVREAAAKRATELRCAH